MNWKVTYQAVPYAYSHPGTLLIEANTAAEAWAVAYHELTRRGLSVSVLYGCCTDFVKELEAMGVPSADAPGGGDVRIRSVEEHKVYVQGRVIE